MNTSTRENTTIGSPQLALLWFGAAISLAEILTGALYRGMGTGGALAAIIGGHLLGGIAFFAVGWISWKEHKDAIAIADSTLGRPGVTSFALVNALQLVGWTAVMIIAGAEGLVAASSAAGMTISPPVSRLLIGALLLIWTAAGRRGIRGINMIAVALLLILSLLWAIKLITLPAGEISAISKAQEPDSMAFGNMLELAVLMPLSWLPLVGDYTRSAKHGRKGVSAATVGYFLGSCGMYLLGLLSVTKLPGAGAVESMLAVGMGVGAAFVVLLSTVTTGFLDVHSAGVSLRLAFPAIGKHVAPLLVGFAGLMLAMLLPGGWYESFLYLLGSLFAPFFGVIFCRRLFFAKAPLSLLLIILGFAAWAAGVGAYYILLPKGTPLGVSLPAMLISMIAYFLFMKGAHIWNSKA
ncbi:cytosine permease [Sediminispirochaeta smaragdinae]|uniref:Permease for cytosine/purines uracil thiamine allantoin n=1 Tax=Sediminispirochaeta smaragdinae (strain DSM 11293 / JCM 15392 / SEBR 4228) TaxID=573413 RepID=E1RC16_SEDSS|nr:cytosine permease [Sediminispirochaeta smaragdinae]ADK79896.1 permease for cytosine/purines uracil thiamine allantoin [Sediminispirochaeta smaragdinae DSM 11293]